MRILNTSGREQTVSGVGVWPVDGYQDVFDTDVAEGILRNPYFVLAEEQPEDVDPSPTETMSVEERVAMAQELVDQGAPPPGTVIETPVEPEETAPIGEAPTVDPDNAPRPLRTRTV